MVVLFQLSFGCERVQSELMRTTMHRRAVHQGVLSVSVNRALFAHQLAIAVNRLNDGAAHFFFEGNEHFERIT